MTEFTDTSAPVGPAPLDVPTRSIPVPQSLSPQARAALAPPVKGSVGGLPSATQIDLWRLIIAGANEAICAAIGPRLKDDSAGVNARELAGVGVFDIVPAAALTGGGRRIHLHIHGGGFLFGGGDACRAMGRLAATQFGVRTFSVDYRTPPDHPYPAALDDCYNVYCALLAKHDPKDIVVSGGSAGANLAAALMLRARDEGLPLPAGLLLFTPGVDLTESGDSFQTNLGIDTVLTRSTAPMHLLYAPEDTWEQPYLSPLFGDFTKGWPPTFLQSGTRDLFLSNTVRMHRRLRDAGVEAELHVFEAMPHGGFGGAPEDEQLSAEVRRFLDRLWH